MFLLPSMAALGTCRSAAFRTADLRPARPSFDWALVWLFITLLVGFRFEVGGDWGTYTQYLRDVIYRRVDFVEILTKKDPSYYLLNWISAEMDWGIFGVNLIGGAIFALGLVVFCQRQPSPWLALAVSIPYAVIVVAMGYSRQGIALGLEMLGLVSLSNKSTLKFVMWVALAGTFHRSAVLLLPIAALARSQNRYLSIAWAGAASAIFYYLLLGGGEADKLVSTYVGSYVQSQGAAVRLVMNALPACILLGWRSRFSFSESERSLWWWLAIIALAMLGLFLVSSSASTALDRMALYMLPLQIVVFAQLPFVFGANHQKARGSMTRLPAGKNVQTLTAGVLLFYGLVQFVWLNFANYSHDWIPYQFYPLMV
jgi:hypothetical protein